MPDEFESVLDETLELGDDFSLDDLDRLFSESSETEEPSTVVEEPVTTPEPVVTQPTVTPPVDHRLPPGVVPVSVVQAEREAKRKALEAEAQLRAEFEAFKQQVTGQVPTAQPSVNDEEVPDERTDPFGAFKYKMEQELRQRDRQLEEMRTQYDNYLATVQSQAESTKIQAQEIDLRRTVGDADYQEKLNAFNELLQTEGQFMSIDAIRRTPNPAWTAYEMGRKHLAAKQVLYPQQVQSPFNPAPAPAPAPTPTAVPGLPAGFDVEAFKQQVIQQATAAAYEKAKQDAYAELKDKIKNGRPTQPAPNLSNVPSNPPVPRQPSNIATVTRDELAVTPKNQIHQQLEELYEFFPFK